MLAFCSAFLFSEARAQDEVLLCHGSASDANQMGFKWNQITNSFPQNAAGSAQIASQMFRVEFTIIDRFKRLRWTSGAPRKDFQWFLKRTLGASWIGSRNTIGLSGLRTDGRQRGF